MVQTKENRSATFWMLVPVALLVISVSGWLWMVSLAVDDPGFALEPDYYKKASSYDEIMNQRERSAQLGYEIRGISFSLVGGDAAELIIQVKDRDGRPVERADVTADGFFVGRAFRVQQLQFESRGEGIYSAQVREPHPGLWEIRLSVLAERGLLFTETVRTELFFTQAQGEGSKTGGPSPS